MLLTIINTNWKVTVLLYCYCITLCTSQEIPRDQKVLPFFKLLASGFEVNEASENISTGIKIEIFSANNHLFSPQKSCNVTYFLLGEFVFESPFSKELKSSLPEDCLIHGLWLCREARFKDFPSPFLGF